MDILAGSTDVSLPFVLYLTDNSEATGLTITALDLQYWRQGETPAAKVDATALAATDSAHADNKAIEVDATDQKALYRVDFPDAAFASGADWVICTVQCSGCFAAHWLVNLTPVPAAVQSMTATERAAVADKLLGRNIAGGGDGTRTVAEALATSRNKVAFDVPAAGQFTVFAADDTTPLWVGAYARYASAQNVLMSVDPT